MPCEIFSTGTRPTVTNSSTQPEYIIANSRATISIETPDAGKVPVETTARLHKLVYVLLATIDMCKYQMHGVSDPLTCR